MLLATPCPTRAADGDGDAEPLLRRGVELRRSGDDEGALRVFQKAYALDHGPRAAAQMGLAEQALGLWADAEGHLGEALREGAGTAWVQKNRTALTEALFVTKKHVARVELSGLPAGALVTVSGRPVGRAPLPGSVRVTEGPVSIKVDADGWRPAHRELTVTGGQFVRLSIDLEPLEHPGVAAAVTTDSRRAPPRRLPAAVEPSTEQREMDLVAAPAPEPHGAADGTSHTWLWITLGALVAAGAGAGAWFATHRTTTYPTADKRFSQ